MPLNPHILHLTLTAHLPRSPLTHTANHHHNSKALKPSRNLALTLTLTLSLTLTLTLTLTVTPMLTLTLTYSLIFAAATMLRLIMRTSLKPELSHAKQDQPKTLQSPQ